MPPRTNTHKQKKCSESPRKKKKKTSVVLLSSDAISVISVGRFYRDNGTEPRVYVNVYKAVSSDIWILKCDCSYFKLSCLFLKNFSCSYIKNMFYLKKQQEEETFPFIDVDGGHVDLCVILSSWLYIFYVSKYLLYLRARDQWHFWFVWDLTANAKRLCTFSMQSNDSVMRWNVNNL